MSISMTAGTVRHSRPRPSRSRLVSGPLAIVFLFSAGALTSFYLLLSVAPMYTAAAGASQAWAGLVTGLPMLASVLAEGAAPALMRRAGSRCVLAAGAVLLGAPTLVLLLHGGLGVMLAVSVIRGLGFGLSVVVTGALVAELVPAGRRGEGAGVAGLVSCVPAVLALPSGVWLAGHCGYALVTVLTATTALAPLAGTAFLPGGHRQPQPETGPAPAAEPTLTLRAGLRQAALARPALVFAATTVSAGTVVAFLPLAGGASASTAAAGLFAQALTAAAGRWWAGRHGDRHGHARLLVPGLLLAATGMVLLATAAVAGPWLPVAAMALFGTGFGIAQNASFAMMTGRVPASGYGAASALWNLAYDAGYGAGPATLGLLAARAGYPVVFAVTAALMLTALPAARRERRTAGR
jgi:MFS family permease